MWLNLPSSRRTSVANCRSADCEIVGKSIHPAVPSTDISSETLSSHRGMNEVPALCKAAGKRSQRHRGLREDEDLRQVLAYRVPRKVTHSLTVQYDRVMYLLEDTLANRRLIHE